MIINGPSLLIASPIVNMAGDKHREHGVSYGLGEAGYDIRIKQAITFTPGQYFTVHDRMRQRNFGQEPTRYTSYTDDGNQEEGIGNFVLASTIEEFRMPLNMVGVVHDKSTWARQGLSVFNTVIEPGWNGFLTLELVYHGRKPLVIPAGSGIAQVIFHEVANPASYTGKYQDQADEPVASVFA